MTESDKSTRNVILVVLDSARADHFAVNSPNFASMTSGGILFKRAIAPAGWTLPSHASMFTGLSPTEHGITAMKGTEGTQGNLRNARRKAKELEGRLIAPQLRAGGIRTFSTTSSPWLWDGAGLSAGFEETDFFYFLGSRPLGSKKSGLLKPGHHLVQAARSVRQQTKWIRSGADKGASRISDSLTKFASRPGRFFAFANLIETHQPHLAPAGYREPGAWGALDAMRDVALEPPIARHLRIRAHNYGTRSVSPRLMKRWQTAYAAEMRYVDDWLSGLMEGLERVRRLDDTVVILTSDHGESFGESGTVSHGLSLSEGAAHVPLGIWGAGISREVVTAPVSLMSLPATLRHVMFDEPEEMSLLSESGRGNARIEIEDPRAVTRPPRRARRLPAGPGAAFYDGSLKYVIDPFTGPALYDLDLDPRGEKNLLPGTSPTTWQKAEADAWRLRSERLAR